MNKKIGSIVLTLLLLASSAFMIMPVSAEDNPGDVEIKMIGTGETAGDPIDVTVGDTDLRYDFYFVLDDTNKTDTVYVAGNSAQYVEWAPANALNYTSSELGSIFINTSASVLPGNPTSDSVDNDAGWFQDMVWADITNHTGIEGRAFNITWDALEVGTVTIWHNDSNAKFNGVSANNPMRTNGVVRIHPQDPSSFTIADEGPDWFNVSWGSAEGIDQYVVVQNKNNIPTEPTDGTEIYNNTGSWYNDTGLDIEDDYYYSIWGYNTSEGYFSLNYDSLTKDSSNGLPTPLTVSTDDKNNIQLSWTCQYEDTAILRPNDNGSSSDWDILGGDSYNWQAVDEESADGDSTAVRTDGVGNWDSYKIESYSLGKPIKEIAVYANAKRNGGSETVKLTIYNGSSTEKSSDIQPDTTYEAISNTWASNPFTGEDWKISDLTDLEIGVEYTGSTTYRVMCTQMYLEITYYDTPDYVIERNSSATWSQGTGTEVFNSTTDGDATSYLDSGLWPDTDYYYQLWTYDDSTNNDLYSTDYLSGNDHTTDNNNVAVHNPSHNNTVVTDRTLDQISIDIDDADGDSFDYTIEGDYITLVDVSGATDGTFYADIAIDENEPYGETITWYVNATDGFDWTNETYSFTFRDEYEPTQPADFTATTDNRTQIDLSWTKVTHGEYIVIERNTTETWSMGAGTEIYNGTGTAYSDDGTIGLGGRLDDGVQYFYQAWSYNVTDTVYSPAYAEDNDTTTGNTVPNQPTLVAINDSDYTSVYDAYLNVTITDPEADTLDITFYWANHTAICFENDVASGSFVNKSLADYIDPDWLDHDTKYEWYVTVDDSFDVYNSSTEVGNYWFNTTHATDINENGEVDVTDISLLVGSWSEENVEGGWIAQDIDNSGEVEVTDVSLFVADWGWKLND